MPLSINQSPRNQWMRVFFMIFSKINFKHFTKRFAADFTDILPVSFLKKHTHHRSSSGCCSSCWVDGKCRNRRCEAARLPSLGYCNGGIIQRTIVIIVCLKLFKHWNHGKTISIPCFHENVFLKLQLTWATLDPCGWPCSCADNPFRQRFASPSPPTPASLQW